MSIFIPFSVPDFGRQFAEAAARRAAAQDDIDESLARLDAARRSLKATSIRVANTRRAQLADQARLEAVVRAIFEDR